MTAQPTTNASPSASVAGIGIVIIMSSPRRLVTTTATHAGAASRSSSADVRTETRSRSGDGPGSGAFGTDGSERDMPHAVYSRRLLTGGEAAAHHLGMNTLQRAEAADHAAIEELERLVIVKSTLYTSGGRDPPEPLPPHPDPGKLYPMCDH